MAKCPGGKIKSKGKGKGLGYGKGRGPIGKPKRQAYQDPIVDIYKGIYCINKAD